MASEIATPAKDAAAIETEVVSVDLPAPAGWKKKFTPKKGGTPKRNEISFISPTGEEITSKRQLEQYLRAHPGGPPSSEFDWGTGDTPRRSARLSANAKAKATETPEGEKPMKRERKSSGKKETKGKKDSEDGETVAPEAADDAAAAGEAKEPADVEMKDAEGNVEKVNEDAGAEAEEEAQKELAEKINENIEEKMEGKQENDSSEKVDQTEPVAPVVEEEKEADKANKEKEDSEMLPLSSEGKKDENAEENKTEGSDMLPPTSEGKRDENAEENKTEGSDMLPPTSEGKENVNAEKEKPEVSAGLPQTLELPKEESPAEKESKDGDALVENDSFEENQEAAVPKEAQHPVNCDDGQHQPRASPVNC